MASEPKTIALDTAFGGKPAYRQPPHNEEAEQALLGAVLANNRAFDKVAEIVSAEHFFIPAHQRIFQAMQTLIGDRHQIASPVTLKNLFEADGDLEHVGGARYLADLAGGVVSVINVEDYARAIADLHLRRELIAVGEDMVNAAHQVTLEDSATDQIETAEKRLFDLASTGESGGGFSALRENFLKAIETAEAAYARDSHVTGVTVGLLDLDRKLGGLHKSDLVILAGRPSMGKTALATNMAFNAASAAMRSDGKEGGVIAFFSLEMSAEQLATRILAEISGVPSDKIRRGEIKSDDFTRFAEATQRFATAPFFIDDTPALTVMALRTRARRLKRTHGLGMIVVDYLQLMRSGPRPPESRVMEISEITRGLKAIAKELDVPVLALSQLSRQVEQREDKRPQLSDLRESGSIEQDADVVMFVYREQYYHERAEPTPRDGEDPARFNERHERWILRGNDIHNRADVIVAKQRHGPIGTVTLHFEGELTRFSDLDTRYDEAG